MRVSKIFGSILLRQQTQKPSRAHTREGFPMFRRQHVNEKDILTQKIAAAKAELKAAGKIHRRDLQKYIHRMEIALKRCGKP